MVVSKMKKVAIVDDSDLIRGQLKKFFEDTMKLEVVAQGGDGDEAIQIYKEFSPDLITMDLIMPNKGGLKAVDEIMQLDSDARILIVSSYRTEDIITKAMNLGAKGFIFKPLELNSECFVEWITDEVNDALE